MAQSYKRSWRAVSCERGGGSPAFCAGGGTPLVHHHVRRLDQRHGVTRPRGWPGRLTGSSWRGRTSGVGVGRSAGVNPISAFTPRITSIAWSIAPRNRMAELNPIRSRATSVPLTRPLNSTRGAPLSTQTTVTVTFRAPASISPPTGTGGCCCLADASVGDPHPCVGVDAVPSLRVTSADGDWFSEWFVMSTSQG
jgi:hypothetical protein